MSLADCRLAQALGRAPRIAVVIPCYKVVPAIDRVLAAVPAWIERIYCVDDRSPDGAADHIQANWPDPRITVLRNPDNLGVGGAVTKGYASALADGMDVVVKVDGDDQMDLALLPRLLLPILRGEADYAKGNRFHDVRQLSAMPRLRLVGNGVLSFFAKCSSGYWRMFDPNNGYTAIHRTALKQLDLDRISHRFFFESDMLFRLGLIRAVVTDVAMPPRYQDEVSNLTIRMIVMPFLVGHARNFLKRVFYLYFLRDFSVASVELVLSLFLMGFGTLFGITHWAANSARDEVTPAGPVMLSALPLIFGFQLLIAWLNYDMANVPRQPLSGDASADEADLSMDEFRLA